jgi:cysteine desulfurase
LIIKTSEDSPWGEAVGNQEGGNLLTCLFNGKLFDGWVSIYLDSSATSRVHPEVVDAMLPYLTGQWHVPSALYRSGLRVREAVEQARGEVADLIGAAPEEILFTAGGTEANNAALKSLAREVGRTHSKIVISAVEHRAVSRPVGAMSAVGFEVETAGVDSEGLLDPGTVRLAVDRARPGFASVMWASDETGVLQPVAEIAGIVKGAGWWFHCDAVAAVGKVPVRVDEVPVDFLALSAHKFHGPKGVGALFIRRGTPFEPMVRGGGEEAGRRGGAENVAAIVGLGRAAVLAKESLASSALDRVAGLRDRFEEGLSREWGEGSGGIRWNGSREHRLPTVSNLSFEGCKAADLIPALDEAGIECAGCVSAAVEKGRECHALKAMGCEEDRLLGGLRFSFSIFTTEAEIDEAVRRILATVKRLRA